MTGKEDILYGFAKNLTRLREERGWSIRELANQANLEYSQVQRIEKGKVNFAYTTLIALADGLGITPSALLDY
jgi:transcriptional regulator with XRE-family HTH domain